MRLFKRRRETLSERLLREGGSEVPQRKQRRVEAMENDDDSLELTEAELFQLRGPWGKEPWDAVVLQTVLGIDCDEVIFWALPDGDLLVDEKGTANATGLAAAVEKKIERPYKAIAARQDDKSLWAIGAVRIEVARFTFAGGNSLKLGIDEETDFIVDGRPSNASIPEELVTIGRQRSDRFEIDAERIDRDLWEVRVSAL